MKKYPEYERSLAYQYPQVAKEWHPTKNGELTPEMVYASSSKKRWWECSNSHGYEMTVGNRTHGKQKCPYCSGKRASPENNFAVTRPDILEFWDYTKNYVKPDQIMPQTGKKYYFFCRNCGRSRLKALNNIVSNDHLYCAVCLNREVEFGNSLAQTNPELAAELVEEWSYKATEVTAKSGLTGVWKCINNHFWEAAFYSRGMQGNGCPYCSKACPLYTTSIYWTYLVDVPKKYTEEWNYNSDPIEYNIKLNKVNNLSLDEWVDENYKPWMISPGADTVKIKWECNKGHIYYAKPNNRTSGKGCPKCRRVFKNGRSKQEKEIAQYLSITYSDIIAPYELKLKGRRRREVDMYIPSLDIIIEYDGSYWHKDKEEQDFIKNQIILEVGHDQAIRIREKPLKKITRNDVLVEKRDSVKNRVRKVKQRIKKLKFSEAE